MIYIILMISFALHLVLNNFKCLIWETWAGFEFCYYTGIGQSNPKMYFWSEVFFQVFVATFILKNLKNISYPHLIAYVIY